jgi:hypothetical protein
LRPLKNPKKLSKSSQNSYSILKYGNALKMFLKSYKNYELAKSLLIFSSLDLKGNALPCNSFTNTDISCLITYTYTYASIKFSFNRAWKVSIFPPKVSVVCFKFTFLWFILMRLKFYVCPFSSTLIWFRHLMKKKHTFSIERVKFLQNLNFSSFWNTMRKIFEWKNICKWRRWIYRHMIHKDECFGCQKALTYCSNWHPISTDVKCLDDFGIDVTQKHMRWSSSKNDTFSYAQRYWFTNARMSTFHLMLTKWE